jgi:PPOX class probable F420-dependent enzyme
MSETLPDQVKEWLDGTLFATLATIGADGQPQLSQVWVGRDGDDAIVSITTNRQKYRNLARDPRATLIVSPPDAPYTYAEIRGNVVLENEGSMATIDAFAKKYMGADRYPLDDGTDNVRIDVRLKPQHIVLNA